MSMEPFNRLVKLAARAFYDDEVVAVAVLDALTRRHWVREDDLAKDLNLQPAQLRRTLQILEDDKLIAREKVNAGENLKLHMISYCCLDYGRFYDVLRYRLRRVKQKRNEVTVQEYRCSNCQKEYTSLDACSLLSMGDGLFHCQVCSGELVEADGEKPADAGDALLEKMEAQLKPLTEQLNRVKDLPVPEFVGLQEWEAQASEDPCGNGEAKLIFAIPGVEVKKAQPQITRKDLPPWMIKHGMSLATLWQKPQEQDAQNASYYSNAADERQVGMESKREDDVVDWEDDVDCEEG